MKIIIRKKTKRLAIFLLISGLGALWLTYFWYRPAILNNHFVPREMFSSFSVLYYYIFNSVLLILIGVMLLLKNYKTYSILAILLGISVTVSLFIFGNDGDGFEILNNLFMHTTFLGMSIGSLCGGTILVPMFLTGVYISAIQGIRYFKGKIKFID